MLVLKGPEVSALYPGRARILVDLDLLVADAPQPGSRCSPWASNQPIDSSASCRPSIT